MDDNPPFKLLFLHQFDGSTALADSLAFGFSYPALLVVPGAITDESIRRFCRSYRHGRIPVITWQHPKTKALMVRGAGYHGKGVMGMLKSHPTSTGRYMASNSACC